MKDKKKGVTDVEVEVSFNGQFIVKPGVRKNV